MEPELLRILHDLDQRAQGIRDLRRAHTAISIGGITIRTPAAWSFLAAASRSGTENPIAARMLPVLGFGMSLR
jgi:hypothetical protein